MSDILVVEDSAVDRRLVARLLEKAHHQVRLAEDGRQALCMLADRLPDVVVADVVMPEIDGLELTEQVRADYPLIPVILMTSQGNEQLALRALRQGATSYVPKRLLADELVDTIRHVLDAASGKKNHSRVMHFLDETVLQFSLDNDCQLVTPLIGYLQETITFLDLCGEADRTRLGIALEEALVNAIHHGNLEISSDLRESDDEAYRHQIEQRRGESPYRDRRVRFTARLTRDEATFVVRDQGPGFDPGSLPDPTDPSNLDKVSGRGVLLMRTFMDEVSYNSTGNEVTMTKRRASESTPN